MWLIIYLCRSDNCKISEAMEYITLIKSEMVIEFRELKLGLAFV